MFSLSGIHSRRYPVSTPASHVPRSSCLANFARFLFPSVGSISPASTRANWSLFFGVIDLGALGIVDSTAQRGFWVRRTRRRVDGSPRRRVEERFEKQRRRARACSVPRGETLSPTRIQCCSTQRSRRRRRPRRGRGQVRVPFCAPRGSVPWRLRMLPRAPGGMG